MKTLSIGWALLILALCSIPGQSVPDPYILGQDKVGHFGMFFVGAWLWLRTWPGRPGRVFAAGVAFSVGTELYQQAVPFLGRTADPYDVVADVLGLSVGFALALWLARRRPAETVAG